MTTSLELSNSESQKTQRFATLEARAKDLARKLLNREPTAEEVDLVADVIFLKTFYSVNVFPDERLIPLAQYALTLTEES
jgi:hypothetical protein